MDHNDLDIVRALHPMPKGNSLGYVAFAADCLGGFDKAFMAPLTLLHNVRREDELLNLLTENGYMSPGTYASAARNNHDTGFHIALGHVKTARLLYLNCLRADLDVGRPEGTASPRKSSQPAEQALEEVRAMVATGILPEPSYVLFSGRGLHLFWLLRAEDGGPLPAHGHLALFRACQIRLLELLRDFAPDRCCKTPVGYVPVPGTYRPAKQHTVTCRPFRTTGPVRTWTLNAIKEALSARSMGERQVNVSARPSRRRTTSTGRPKDPKKQRAGIASAKARLTRMLADLRKIEEHWGGPRKGDRRYFLQLLAAVRVRLGHTAAAIEQELAAISVRCRPRYPSESNDTSIPGILEMAVGRTDGIHLGDGSDTKSVRHATLADRFGITRDLAIALDLATLIPQDLRDERSQGQSRRTRNLRGRRQALADLLADRLKQLPPPLLSDLSAGLAVLGYSCSDMTVSRDLTYLQRNGQAVNRCGPGRPPMSPKRDECLGSRRIEDFVMELSLVVGWCRWRGLGPGSSPLPA